MVRISSTWNRLALRALSASVAVGSLGSCRDPQLLPLDSRLVMSLAEERAVVQLRATTEKSYPCEGHLLVVRRSRDGSQLVVAFPGVRAPEGPCGERLAPASGSVELGELPAGDYLLGFYAPGRSTRVNLRVTAESLLVVGGETGWTTWPEHGFARR